MNYAKISKCDIANGNDVRVVLWISGCDCRCEGCHNAETWDCSFGTKFDEEAKRFLIDCLSKEYIDGITYSGGHPLSPENYEDITNLAREIKKIYPQKTQWLYTGYEWNEVMEKRSEILPFIDVLVDGRYEKDSRNVSIAFRGSDNQRLIDVPRSLSNKTVVLWEERV